MIGRTALRFGFSFVMAWTLALSQASAQFGNDAEPDAGIGAGAGPKLNKQLKQRWRVGLEITATNGYCVGIFGTVPVPTDWPEQQVRVVEEDISPHVRRIQYRVLEDGVKQMLVDIPRLQPGETATAMVTFEVVRSSILAPENPMTLELPRSVPRDIRKFLAASPYIETRHSKIRTLAREVLADKDDAPAWEQVETIYDYVRDNIEYKTSDLKGAVAALEDGFADCEDMTSLFIALCRANKIPARTVWIPDHCYPEFYLVDAEGEGHWVPCQVAGTRAFGSMPEHRPVLQKGDNFRVPEKRKPQRYVAEFLKVKAIRGTGKPNVRFERLLLPADG